MFERIRWYSRTHPPGRDESALLALLGAPLALLLTLGLAFPSAGQALAGAGPVYVRIPAGMPAPIAQRLVSALEAQLADLAPIDLSAPSAERALCVVLVTEVEGGLSIQLANARAQPVSAPRFVPGAADELSASQVASIVRAFVVARLDGEQAIVLAAAQSESERANGHAAEQHDAQERAPQAQGTERASQAAKREPEPAQAAASLLAPPPAPDAAAGAQSLPLPESSGGRRPVAIDQMVGKDADAWKFRLAALYSGVNYAPELPWQNTLRVEASARLQRWLYLGAGYGYQLPGEVTQQAVQVRIQGHSVNAFLGLGRSWRSFGTGVDLGLGALQTSRATTQVVDAALAGTPAFSYWSAVGTLRLHGRLRFPALPRFALDLAPALEFVGGTREAVVDLETNGETPVLSPRSLRARVDVGAAFDVF
jgi:hypothetical protein